MFSPKNWEFRMICQLAICDDRRPSTGLGLSQYTLITHSVKRRHGVTENPMPPPARTGLGPEAGSYKGLQNHNFRLWAP
ncbi:hypothetical protein TNCV_2879911 [Trichonephila clavipes]|uniref:Uncharacterized protein n=1 Tax=Trichonephila clavipes TaxID=2585209 RepID=A0A8X6W1Q4_TRICX|nr:hypothetical protein TNCV_2879911 [Trichonephila clavipes]